MQGVGLQMCRNTSKGGNDAMSIYTRSETDSDYIRQATDFGQAIIPRCHFAGKKYVPMYVDGKTKRKAEAFPFVILLRTK